MSEKERSHIPTFPQISMIAAQVTTAMYLALLLKQMSGVKITAEVKAKTEKEVVKKINRYTEVISKDYKNRPI